MKKSLVLLTVLLLAGTLAFAVDVTPEWSLDLNVSTTVGYDFNVKAGGIQNSPTSEFRFAYVPKSTWSKGGEGWHGYIEAKDVQWSFINDMWDSQDAVNTDDYYSAFADDIKNSAGTITAKIVYNNIYILISNGVDDLRFNYAANVDGYSDVNFFALKNLYTNAGTLGLGYTSDMLSARLTLLSEGDFASILATAQVDKSDGGVLGDFFDPGLAHVDPITARTAGAGDYGIGLWVTVNPIAMLSVDAKAYIDPFLEFGGFGALLTLKPMDLLTFTFGVDAFDDWGATVFEIDLKPAVTLNLGDDTLTASLYFNTIDGYVANTDSEMDVSLKFVEADADAGFLPIVGASLEAGLNNLSPATGFEMDWSVTAKANATFGALNPYAEFKMSPNAANTDQMIKLEAGAKFTGIANTVITLKYVATDLTSVQAADGIHDDYQNDKGRLTLNTKISY